MKIYQGTELKLNVSIEPIDGLEMENYDFDIEVFALPPRVLTFKKSDAIRVDANNYIILVDSNLIRTGEIKCKVTAYIPDGDFKDGFRTEVAVIYTGIEIVKLA